MHCAPHHPRPLHTHLPPPIFSFYPPTSPIISYQLPCSSLSPASAPPSPTGRIRGGNLLNGAGYQGDERKTQKEERVLVEDQNRPGTRKMFRLGQRACQNHQALVFDEDLLVQDLRVT